MKAILIDENKDLRWTEVEKPSPKAGEILLRIHAAAVNRADLLQRKGSYPSPAGWPELMGLEAAGTVEALGEGAEDAGFALGDKVCALLGGGGYAEYVCVPKGMVMPIPKGLSFEEAASLPEAYATSFLNLVYEGHMQAGDTVFIPAGGSGLASAAIPLAKALGGRVITTVRSAEKAEKISCLGADLIVNTAVTDLEAVMKEEAAAGHPVKVVMDCVAGEILAKTLPYMAEGAYWVLISTLGGTTAEIPLRAVLTKGLHIVGSMLRKRSSAEKAEILKKLTETVWPLLENGSIRPSVYRVFPIEEALAAHEALERSENIGKVVLKVTD